MAQQQEPTTWSEMILDELSMMKGFLSFEDPEQPPPSPASNEELQYFLMSDEPNHKSSHPGSKDPPGNHSRPTGRSFDTDSMRAQQHMGSSFDTDTVRAVAPPKSAFPSVVAVPPKINQV